MVLGMKATITDVCLSLCPSVTNTFEYDSNPKILYLDLRALHLIWSFHLFIMNTFAIYPLY